MDARLHQFQDVSAALTGFSVFELAATDMSGAYLRTLDEVLPPGFVDRLLAAAAHRPDALLEDPAFGPVARNIILLWYRGAWSALPPDWRAAHGASSRDEDRVVSGDAYRAGLQWTVAGAHPSGADAQGYAAWASPPETGPPETAPQ